MQYTENMNMTEDYAGCFGDYSHGDMVCRKFCALSIRCAIEYEQMEMMELMEDFSVSEQMYVTVQ